VVTTSIFANNIIPKKEKPNEFGAFFAKRNFMNAPIADLENTNSKHYSFIQRLGIKRLQYQIKKEFRKRNLLTDCVCTMIFQHLQTTYLYSASNLGYMYFKFPQSNSSFLMDSVYIHQ
jgi:hypothetical protein